MPLGSRFGPDPGLRGQFRLIRLATIASEQAIVAYGLPPTRGQAIYWRVGTAPVRCQPANKSPRSARKASGDAERR